jgi:hypothetical protein
MSRPPADMPERLLGGDATDFERRVLEGALGKQPSAAASARMAKALGVTAAVVGTGGAAAATTLAAGAAASKATVATGATVVWPWVAGGVLGLVVAGAVVGARAWRASPPEPHPAPPSEVAPRAPEPPGPPAQPAAVPAEPPPSPATPSRLSRARVATGDLGDQITFIDGARAAISAGDGRRALGIVRRYQGRYPAGSFRPEATALMIEALVKLGRDAEARPMAKRFVAEHRGTLLANRVAELAGLAAAP